MNKEKLKNVYVRALGLILIFLAIAFFLGLGMYWLDLHEANIEKFLDIISLIGRAVIVIGPIPLFYSNYKRKLISLSMFIVGLGISLLLAIVLFI